MKSKINPALLAKIAAGASLKTDMTVSDLCDIHIASIVPNPHQPRIDIDPNDLSILAESIRLYGLIQPITVVRCDDGYTLVSGHTRVEAHKLLRLVTIRANIIEADEEDLAMLALIENITRSDLAPLEIAIALSREPFVAMRDDEIGAVLGYSSTKIRNLRAILRLNQEVIDHLRTESPKIGVDILVEIQKLPDDTQMNTYLNYINGIIERSDIRAAVRVHNQRQLPKPSSPISRVGDSYKIDCRAIMEDTRENFERELDELLHRYTI